MTPRKLNRAFAIAGITMTATRAHIERQIEPQREMLAGLTSRQLAGVIRAAVAIYHEGRASCAAQVVDDAVWIGSGVDKLLPLAALRAIVIDERVESVRKPYTGYTYPHAASIRDALTEKFVDRAEFMHYRSAGVARDYYYDESSHITHMQLDYTERS